MFDRIVANNRWLCCVLQEVLEQIRVQAKVTTASAVQQVESGREWDRSSLVKFQRWKMPCLNFFDGQ